MRTPEEKALFHATRNAMRAALAGGGRPSRHHQLAFALVRGRPYRLSELTTREHNGPSATTIAELSQRPVDAVKAWIAVPATPAMLEAARAAAEKCAETKSTKRAALEADAIARTQASPWTVSTS